MPSVVVDPEDQQGSKANMSLSTRDSNISRVPEGRILGNVCVDEGSTELCEIVEAGSPPQGLEDSEKKVREKEGREPQK